MLSIYIAGALFGGVLITGSLVGGHGHHAGDAGGSDGHGNAHAGSAAGHDDRGNLLGRLRFFSLRFWAFATAFFGLTGAALTLVGGLGAITPVVAGAVGLTCGSLAGRVLGRLGGQSVGLIGDASAHVGREAHVLLPIEPGKRGKIRLSIGGVSTDLVAEMDEAQDAQPGLRRGEQALVVELRGNVAVVERSPTARLPASGSPMPGSSEKEKT